MRYLPKSDSDRTAMMAEIGVGSIDELFACIPAAYRLKRDLNVPRQMAESEIVQWFAQRSHENAEGLTFMVGAGAYHHYRPIVIDALVQRGEFLTSYTPYQAEIAQGTLQAIFEFQSMICELTGMEVANASMYDASTAAVEAIMMAERVTGRSGAIVARSVHPEHREVIATYAKYQGMTVGEVNFAANGRVDAAALEAALASAAAGGNPIACVLVQSPNFFGTIEDVAGIAEITHKAGALLAVSITEAISLGIVKPPVEADIVAMEAQSFGVPLAFGGPYCGVLATREKFVRQMPGRLAGQASDKQGRRGFVLTLATREQHIRREKATSNICTNQALVALMATIFMTVYGKVGLRELAKQNLAKGTYAAETLGQAGELLFPGAPRFHEFALRTKSDPEQIRQTLALKKIVGGLPLAKYYPELGNASLWCATETTSRVAIDAAAEAIR